MARSPRPTGLPTPSLSTLGGGEVVPGHVRAGPSLRVQHRVGVHDASMQRSRRASALPARLSQPWLGHGGLVLDIGGLAGVRCRDRGTANRNRQCSRSARDGRSRRVVTDPTLYSGARRPHRGGRTPRGRGSGAARQPPNSPPLGDLGPPATSQSCAVDETRRRRGHPHGWPLRCRAADHDRSHQ